MKPLILKDRDTQFVHLIINNRRRRIIVPSVIEALKRRFPGIEIRETDLSELSHFQPGAVVPRDWDVEHWIEPPATKQAMREIIVSRLRGKGIEFGAGSRPMPLPLEAEVEYVEPFQSAEQYERMNYSENTVVPRYSSPIEQQAEFEDSSLDFIVAAHVIEHTPNPIGAIVESYRTLREGGQLVLVMPDKRRTFDRNREITPLDHLVEDFVKPDRARDLDNYLDHYRNAKRQPDEEAIKAHAAGIDIHYHVWTPASFHVMMQHIVDNCAPYRSFEIKPPVADPKCLEFYMVARK